jgi:hypothetical protein
MEIKLAWAVSIDLFLTVLILLMNLNLIFDVFLMYAAFSAWLFKQLC